MLFLELEKELFLMRKTEYLQNDPFCNLGTMNSRRSGQGDLSVFVNGRLGNVISSGTKEMNEVQVWD